MSVLAQQVDTRTKFIREEVRVWVPNTRVNLQQEIENTDG